MLQLFVLLIQSLLVHQTTSLFPQPRLLGAFNASEGQFPFMVSIRFTGTHHCGGSILSQRFVLTTASCVFGFEENSLHIVVGPSITEGYTIYDVAELIFHPKFHPTLNKHNIALLKVTVDIVINKFAVPIQISDKIDDNKKLPALAIGWTDGEILQCLNVFIIDWFACSMHYSSLTEYDSIICTTLPAGLGICEKDLGGPLIVEGKIVGVSMGSRGCGTGSPGVYVRVSYYKEWILNITSVINMA